MRYLILPTTPLLALLLAASSWATVPFERPNGGGDYEEIRTGYAALFTCSAHFIMGRALDDIRKIELVDLGTEQPHIEIDPARQLVRAWGEGEPTAVAAYRDTMGCTLIPPHWQEGDIAKLPYVAMPTPPDVANLAFPAGDKVRLPRLKRSQQQVLDAAFDGTTFGDGTVTVATLVIKDGQLIAERYRDGFGVHTGYRTWSTAKSVAATLVGIAIGDGVMQLDEPTQLAEWSYLKDPRQAITVRHLLQMSSGLYSTGAATGALYFGGQDVVSSTTRSFVEAEPGTRWKYANADTLLLLYALRQRLDNDLTYLRYPYDELFHKLGMYHSRYEIDHQGNFIGSSQMYTTARDLARFGMLYLQDGVWEGEQLLPPDWSTFVATAAPALPREDDKRGYGGQFWLLDRFAGIPPGTYTTAGNKGQFVTVIPAANMVVVRTGVDPNGKRWREHEFVRAVVENF